MSRAIKFMLFLLVLLAPAFCFAACANLSGDNIYEPAGSSARLTTENAPVLETENQDFETGIINNGHVVVMYNGNYLYWKLNDGGKYTLIREDQEGNTEELLVNSRRYELYVMGDDVYINSLNGTETFDCCSRISLIDGPYENIEGRRVVAATARGDVLLMQLIDSDDYILYSDGEETYLDDVLDGAFYCGSGRDSAFFSKWNNDEMKLSIYRMDLLTFMIDEIASVSAGGDYRYAGVEGIQETSDRVYICYGARGGSGNYFQPESGQIICVNLTDKEMTVLSQAFDSPDYSGPKFCVYGEGEKETILYSDGTQVCEQIVATGEIIPSDRMLGSSGEPFAVDNGTLTAYYAYLDGSDTAVKLTEEMELGWDSDISKGKTLDYIEVIGDFVFYDFVFTKENEEPSSWRDTSVEYRRELYRRNYVTGEQQLMSQGDY